MPKPRTISCHAFYLIKSPSSPRHGCVLPCVNYLYITRHCKLAERSCYLVHHSSRPAQVPLCCCCCISVTVGCPPPTLTAHWHSAGLVNWFKADVHALSVIKAHCTLGLDYPKDLFQGVAYVTGHTVQCTCGPTCTTNPTPLTCLSPKTGPVPNQWWWANKVWL